MNGQRKKNENLCPWLSYSRKDRQNHLFPKYSGNHSVKAKNKGCQVLSGLFGVILDSAYILTLQLRNLLCVQLVFAGV